jgi:hypothetical protein
MRSHTRAGHDKENCTGPSKKSAPITSAATAGGHPRPVPDRRTKFPANRKKRAT